MKPGFALSLSFDGISLLQRAAGGWRFVGEVAVDSPDLSGDLAILRAKPGVSNPDDLCCKVIIPHDEIRYIDVSTGSFDGDARDAMIRTALEDATPYPVDDLVYDTSVDGDTTHVAAVVRETLQEAEEFAVEHGFNPVGFVAVPGDESFLGEPYFGPTAFAATLLDGETVEPDGISVVVIGPVEISNPEEAQAPSVAGFSSRRKTETPAQMAEDDSGPETEPSGSPLDDEMIQTPEPIMFKSAQAQAGNDAASSDISTDPDTETDTEMAGNSPIEVTAPDLDIPTGDETKKKSLNIGEFLSRRKRSRRIEPTLAAASRTVGEFSGAAFPKAPIFADTSANDPVVTAVSRPTDSAFVNLDNVSPQDQEKARMTVFGARAQAMSDGEPRHLGLILTVGLLVVLAAIAVWASIFLDGGVAALFRSAPAKTELAAVPDTPGIGVKATDPAMPSISDEATAPSSDTVAPVDLAQLPTSDVDIPSLPAPRRLNQPEPPTNPDLTDADSAVLDALRQPEPDDPDAQAEHPNADASDGAPETGQALTSDGLLDTAPQVPRSPSIIGLNDLYIPSIDRTDLSQDAIALPSVAMLETDFSPGSVLSPAAAGTVFALDQSGLVLASVEGTLTPDGVLVYLGRPDVVPPAIPARLQTGIAQDRSSPRLAGFRPRLRPSDLEERFERVNLGGLTRVELGGLRPKARPKSLQQSAEPDEADQPPTAQAVVSSSTPRARPSNFAAIVQAALPAPSSAADGTQIAVIAPATVTPSIPSSASVARQATLRNEINLRRVNLIGVYGNPSNRRALVRLPSGRYKKVKVGDTVDGGRVVAIGDSELRYQKSGRSLTLKIPSS